LAAVVGAALAGQSPSEASEPVPDFPPFGLLAAGIAAVPDLVAPVAAAPSAAPESAARARRSDWPGAINGRVVENRHDRFEDDRVPAAAAPRVLTPRAVRLGTTANYRTDASKL
jgi:hypothetical protein